MTLVNSSKVLHWRRTSRIDGSEKSRINASYNSLNKCESFSLIAINKTICTRCVPHWMPLGEMAMASRFFRSPFSLNGESRSVRKRWRLPALASALHPESERKWNVRYAASGIRFSGCRRAGCPLVCQDKIRQARKTADNIPSESAFFYGPEQSEFDCKSLWDSIALIIGGSRIVKPRFAGTGTVVNRSS